MATTSQGNGSENNNIITLISARQKHYRSRCEHLNILVDITHTLVECEDCGEKLNPVAILDRVVSEQDFWRMSNADMRKQIKKLKEERRRSTNRVKNNTISYTNIFHNPTLHHCNC